MAIDEKQHARETPAARTAASARASPLEDEKWLLPTDELGVGILLAEPGRRFLIANRFACLLLGYGRDELLAAAPDDVFVAPQASGDVDSGSGITRLRRKDGTTIIVRYEARDVALGPVRLAFWLVYPRRLLNHEPRTRLPQRPVELTARELEILQLLADGCDNVAVSQQLQISPETVKSHVRRVLQKLDANSRTHAVAIALRNSLVG